MATDNMGGFTCPDDHTFIHPHGGFLDLKKKQLVFFAICPACVKAGRPSKVMARVDLDFSTFYTAKEDGLLWAIFGGEDAA